MKEKEIKIKDNGILYLRGEEIFMSQDTYKTLLNLSNDEKINLIKSINNDFYINDGYDIDIKNFNLYYHYDNGIGDYNLIVLGK